MKTLLKYTFYLYKIVNLALIKVIYNWLHESHKTTNTSTNSRNNDLNGYTCNVFNTNTLKVWVQPSLYSDSRNIVSCSDGIDIIFFIQYR